MTGADDWGFNGLPLSAILRINALCDSFEAELRAGRAPRIEDTLGHASGLERETLFLHLTRIETEYRGISIDEFVRRLVEEEFLPDGYRPITESATELAEELVRTTLLTPYQARTLLGPHPHAFVLDDYLILDRVGSGGMGTVYRAIHRRMKRIVALKVCRSGHANDAQRNHWFQREVEAAAQLTHPNVVTAYDAGEARGVAYLVSEFVEGNDLHHWVAEHGPMPLPVAVQAIRDAAAGLGYAHERGIIHRDVKPSNLMRTPDGVIRVLDVGLARLIRQDAHAGERVAVVGTPAYMAPEQASDPVSVDPRADVYSLGCTLFYLVMGRSLPTDRANPTLCPTRSRVPSALDSLFRRMTARRPQDRPRSMVAVIAELEKIQRRRQRVWVMSALVVGLAGVAITIGVIRSQVPIAQSDLHRSMPQSVTEPPAPSSKMPPLQEVPFDGSAYQLEWGKALNVPLEFEPIPGMKARLIPPGRFVLGTPADVLDRLLEQEQDEAARERLRGEVQRQARIDSPFYLGTTEVTVAQFRRFIESNSPPYLTVAERPDGLGFRLDVDRTWRVVPGPSWRWAGEQPLTDAHPVCNLGRDDCADFCRWLTIQLGGRYECRLPTEVEWEFACRAGSAGLWSCGSESTELGPIAWYAGTVDAADSCFRPVGRKAPNGFGLFDMHGNLEEWCTASPPMTGAVLRGGHVRSSALGIRSAVRESAPPTSPRGGFRVVLLPTVP